MTWRWEEAPSSPITKTKPVGPAPSPAFAGIHEVRAQTARGPSVCAGEGAGATEKSLGLGGFFALRDELVFPITLGEQKPGQVGVVDARPRRLGHRRLGVEGDPQARGLKHVEIVGPVAHRQGERER
jgi:hypothetical protein